MDIYKIMKMFGRLGGRRAKLTALLCAHLSGRRYIGIFLDPVMACNIRCRMCYFSDSAKRKEIVSGRFAPERMRLVEEKLFPHALKLQIGCAAEPTLYKSLPEIVKSGKKYKIPYISITTNGQLMTPGLLHGLVSAGLDEITLSVHGMKRETYEYLMDGASWDRFTSLLAALKEIKREFPRFKVRINYVMNDMNTFELRDFWTVLDGLDIDIVQFRPVQDMGDTGYTNFDLSKIIDNYDTVIQPIIDECHRRGIVCIAPTRQNLTEVNHDTDEFTSCLEKLTYYYVSATGFNKDDFDIEKDNFKSYHKRHHTARSILKSIFSSSSKAAQKVTSTKKLNYDIN